MLTRRSLLWCGAGLACAQTRGPRPGVQTNAWEIEEGNFASLLSVLERVRKLDFDGFETNIRFLRSEFPRPAEARRKFADLGLTAIGAHYSLAEPFRSDVVVRDAAGAASVGAQYLVTSHKGLAADGRFAPDQLQAKVRFLNEAGRRCRAEGIRIAYHNHQPEFVNNAAEIEGLLQGTDPDNMMLLWDSGHAWLAGCALPAFLRRHAARIAGIHLRDYRDGKSVPLGQGTVPLRDLAAAIRQARWAGWLIDEEERPNEPKPEESAVQPSRHHIRKVFGV
ncbi:MAG: sugar phosphate isomerase/epimerase [Bryobacteraceae bacterium]|nr:sugar phosphate isomerase/epimerase [Bryobacteraceae bacterium]